MCESIARQNKKILIIGIDGGTFDLIKPWTDEGRLPNFKYLMKGGSSGLLMAPHQCNSPQSWSTFITGKNAGKHGIFDFIDPIPHSYDVRFVNGGLREGKSIWQLIGDRDKKVVVVNVPITYPPEKVSGCMISGLDSPGISNRISYPPGLISEIEKEVGPYMLEPGVWGYIRKGKADPAFQEVMKSIDRREKWTKYLMENKPWDFFMVVFTETDRVQHHFWRYMNPEHEDYNSETGRKHRHSILKVYERVDLAIGALIKGLDEEVTVIVMSDHGFGPSSNKTIFLNRWLADNGFLKYSENGTPLDSLKMLHNHFVKKANLWVNKVLSRQTKEKLMGLLPALRNKVESTVRLMGIDWGQTLVYSRENAPVLFVNLKGREPCGIVNPGSEYERIRDNVIERLLKIRCPRTGENIISKVYKREELYHGKFIHKAPDLLLEYKDHAYIQRPGFTMKGTGPIQFLEGKDLKWAEQVSRPSGIHRREGILIAKGPEVKRGCWIGETDIVNLTPTILYLLGIDIPKDFDGQVIRKIFDDKFLSLTTINYSEKIAEGCRPIEQEPFDEEIIQDRLRGLGYID